MDILINTGAATDDAAQIDSIVSTMKEHMDTLDRAIKSIISLDPPKDAEEQVIYTDWALEVRNNWDKYYNADVQEAMENMKLSATNLRLAVEKALAYNNEQ